MALGMVPLLVAPPVTLTSTFALPKVALFRVLVALMALAIAVQWGLDARGPSPWARLRTSWHALSPASRAVVAFAAASLAAHALATLTSASWRVSLWGGRPGGDSYSLYTTIGYVLLFMVVAFRLRSSRQLWRLVAVVAGAGTLTALYGVMQQLGVDPLGLDLFGSRLGSTLANPIFAGQYWVLTLTTTAVWVLARASKRSRWPFLVGGWLALGVQGAALVAVVSLGPQVAALAAVATLALLSLGLFGWHGLARLVMVLAPAAVIAGVLVTAPTSSATGENRVVEAVMRVERLETTITAGSFRSRTLAWEGAVRQMTERPWFAGESDGLSYLRPLVGYGPDTFFYVLPLSEPAELFVREPPFRFAHNHLIQTAFEAGLFGLAALVGLAAAGAFAGLRWLVRARGNVDPDVWLMAGVLAALAGWAVSMLVGIARVSDLMLVWVLLAVVVAIRESPATRETPAASTPTGRQSFAIAQVAVVGLAALGMLSLTVFKDVRYVIASRAGVEASDAMAAGELDASLAHAQRATDLAPEVPLYYRQRSFVLGAGLAREASGQERTGLLEAARSEAAAAVALNPWSSEDVAILADVTMALGLEGDAARLEEAVALYQRLVDLAPRDYARHLTLAEQLALVGRPAEALEAARMSTSLAGEVRQAAPAYVLQARLLFESGDLSGAVDAAERALTLGGADTQRDAHLLLANAHLGLGDRDTANLHMAEYQRMAVQD